MIEAEPECRGRRELGVAAGISVAIIAVVQGLGSKLSATFVQDAFK